MGLDSTSFGALLRHGTVGTERGLSGGDGKLLLHVETARLPAGKLTVRNGTAAASLAFANRLVTEANT